ncbi:MAG: DNA repair protein RadA [Bacteroidia bacterium]|nr:DNA repair protein RadA [Bacteroidia bacterium]NNC84945.1 DNA repair protein RadA [Bacteroidia bacterium]NNM16227.1 DNA repair protein RadA [Bacteroidia bacterium]
MAKVKSVFFCQSCGTQSTKWVGKCPSCSEWNTIVEEVVTSAPATKGKVRLPFTVNQVVPIQDVKSNPETRVMLPDAELNRLLGGGLVKGSLCLLGGEPGIGKSTLLLQIAIQASNLKILYVSGEESEQQIKMRAERVGMKNEQCYILASNSLDTVMDKAAQLKPDLLIIDSIQTLYSGYIESSAGTVSQIRYCAGELMRFAKESNTSVFLIGHITKEGYLAGPKVLEHMVDTVLQFEGDRHHIYRILRSSKNRFGSTSEIGIYEMQANGLREVENPSSVLLSEHEDVLSGNAIACTIEGARPMLIETQALVSTAVYGTPQRSSTGFDTKRMNMLLAVLEKRCGFKLASKDVFLNLAGGIRVEDPAIDLAVICAILSSNEDVSISSKNCFAGEIGLTGEVRPVSRMEQRIKEAEKLGFERIYFSKYNVKNIQANLYKNIELIPVKHVEETFSSLFS